MTDPRLIHQLGNLVFALAKGLAVQNPQLAKDCLASAIYASRKDGSGDEAALEIYSKCFPDQPVPDNVSDDVMSTIIARTIPKG